MRIVRWWSLILALASSMPAIALADTPSPFTTVFLVRHAEKNTHAPGGDAGLSAKGQLRARELARVLGSIPLDAVYTTSFGRARMTADVVARAQRDSVTLYDPERVDLLAERIKSAGGSVLVVGHGDTLPHTYESLTGERFPDGNSIPYDKLYVVVLTPTSHRLITLRYGAAAE